MDVLESVDALRSSVQKWREAGLTIGFVPTMGNLHAGHLSLVEEARQKSDKVIVSVFVNPLQFGPNEDFNRYPRTFEADKSLLQQYQADAIFCPSVDEMYPHGQTQTLVTAPEKMTGILEGDKRPGHFDGVTTVVAKLFNMVQPDIAVFGQKDFQQFAVLQQMVEDLAMPITLIRAPIVRNKAGLALSSRNQYLTESQRLIAPKLFVALQSVEMAIQSGNRNYESLCQSAVQQVISDGFDSVDYIQVLNSVSLENPGVEDKSLVVLAAAKLGNTRLLDNILVIM
ncbi:pantoate--beta-alanine ligase [Hydrogenovibrio sp. 3SP14C1]|uniref:pantoate--beta-alanine ligase n=1 Tax=Hydrogenovibrio sp. 3SP14C1 TaxID=3038774 RepID=UPI002417506F|nr:pantoate--beta-alanine ligase [Hydrogenovibrio sp. 3SP14C1]MDG4813374.1 pantoate--beta-alanine ligase [Hydrogenovibrio sp. 3SP14C1]